MDQNLLTSIVMIGLMIVAFYLLILRPQRKRQAEQRATLENLQPGTRVLTSTGVYGNLVRLGERQAVIELSPGHEMTVVKHAIVRVVQPGDEDLEMTSARPGDEVPEPLGPLDEPVDEPEYTDSEVQNSQWRSYADEADDDQADSEAADDQVDAGVDGDEGGSVSDDTDDTTDTNRKA
ncbi:preprotein translocase subunit YajC [Propionibacteriaceae bacterium Y2011]